MVKNIHDQRVLILDFGSQYTQLIARSIREIGVFCELCSVDIDQETIRLKSPKAIILSGGPESVSAKNSPKTPAWLYELDIPILGICYGMQLIVQQLGGTVSLSDKREFGYAQVDIQNPGDLFEGVEDSTNIDGTKALDVWMSHGDQVDQCPEGFTISASTLTCPIAAIEHRTKRLYGLQFHPEVTHTKQGKKILERFILDIAGCQALWIPKNIVDGLIADVKDQVGDQKVLLGLSGGVDSNVVAALLHKAIGDQLVCVFVDNGLLRLNEGDDIMTKFEESMGVRVIRCNKESLFLDRLKGVKDPEEKRKIIGNTFIEVFDEQASKLDGIQFLAQGTIYPDVIESAGSALGNAHVIKSHHNVGGLPDFMTLKLVEPLRELFKDEVRAIGVELGLPNHMVYRHPFPGPGLGVRILGEVKKEYCDILREADAIFLQELREADWHDKVSQAFVVFLPVKSVGVVGDGRRYEYVVALRAVETVDFMTARIAHLPYDLLERISSRIINEIPYISRVSYDISSKPPSTIEWE